jgi:methionyl-tRNA formyltransferase
MPITEDILRPTILAAGYKGTRFVAGLLKNGVKPRLIATYRQDGDVSNSFDQLAELGRSHALRVEETRRPDIEKDRLVLVVGWQFLLRNGLDRCIVFHDSLLPQFRGFAPTVTALLLGVPAIGVSAIQPNEGPDHGKVYGSRIVHIKPGASLRAIFDLQTEAMVDLAVEIIDKFINSTLVGRPQDHEKATQSLWRDEYDYFIDWRLSAPEIIRHVQASGFPYLGAKAILDNQVITLDEVTLGPDLSFAIRNPGKLWQIEDRRALVVCGRGTIWIDKARDDTGKPFRFTRLRTRFLTADTAWLSPFCTTLSQAR